MASSRDILKKASTSGVEGLMQSVMPQLQTALTSIQNDLRHMDARMVQLDQKLDDRFDQLRDTVNQLGDRIARVEGKLEAYVDLSRQQLSSTQGLIERVVRLEALQPTRRRRAS